MLALTQYKFLHWYCAMCEPAVQSQLSTPNSISTVQEKIKTLLKIPWK